MLQRGLSFVCSQTISVFMLFDYYIPLVRIQTMLYNFDVVLGAFIPGVPVQPVLLRYPNKLVRQGILYS